MAGKGALRSIKNIAKGFSDVQIKVREATSNDPWGPSGTLMNEIAQLTFNESDFIEIMDMIDKRLNDKGKNWRHVFKALLLLDYCLHVGSENVVLYARENIYVVKTLKEFQHVEENGKDVGANIRQKAKDITNLLQDDNRLKEERRQRQGMRDRMANVGDYLNESVRQYNGAGSNTDGRWDDESELRKALAESKRIAAEEEKNRRQGDDDLEKALQLSQQEASEKERKDKERLEKENTEMFFGSVSSAFQTHPQQQAFYSTMNNPYQQQHAPLQLNETQPIIQFSEPYQNNPYQQQQVPNPYFQANQFNTNDLQAQMTGFPQQSSLQAQMTGLPQQLSLPAQMTGFPQQQPSFQTNMVTGTNPFSQMNQQAPQQQQQLTSPVFGSNTPNFTFSIPPASSSSAFANATATQLSSSPAFANTNSFAPSPAFAAATTASNAFNSPSSHLSHHANVNNSSPKLTQQDSKYSKLNALLANNNDGLDTFGNVGNLRFPSGSGFANSSVFQSKSNETLASPQSFAQQNSQNPFGQVHTTPSNDSRGQKSLLEMMQEQKQHQHQQQQQQQQSLTAFNSNSNLFF
ncbi:hypothetical protein [Parasitella parasitica]|uniref:ENTH domain-containing protein n=1 Tax=Parasitella parasitica TaxID=35722 RepID=A0A0B7NNI3_9FUNG|nr:hypothetical protein [Parasitella parasitica]